jgi:hypothetical protein
MATQLNVQGKRLFLLIFFLDVVENGWLQVKQGAIDKI